MTAALIVLMGSLGDIARALPLAGLVRRRWPQARISWAVDWRWQALLARHPAVDRLVVFPRERTLPAVGGFIRTLRAERYDVALDLQRILKSGLCSLWSGSPRRIGFDRASAKEGNALFNNEHIAVQPAGVSKLRHYLAFAEHLGLAVPETLDFGLDRFRDARLLPADARAVGAGFLAIVMGSSWRTKDWNAEGYRDLVATVLRETGRSIVLLGDAAQRGTASRVAAAAPGARVTNLAGRTSLAELCSILAAAKAVVGPDSGPGHVAAALGVPCVVLFGPTDAGRVAPYRCKRFAVRTPVPCLGCSRHRCRRRGGRCMDAIGAPMVWDVLKTLL